MNVQERSERDFVLSTWPVATYEHVGAGIVEVDSAGRLVRVNQHLCRLTGFSAPDLLGRSLFEMTHPEDAGRDLAQFNRQLAGEIGPYTLEKRMLRDDGSYFWAEVTSTSVCDATGKFLYAVHVQHDVTSRKQAECDLARRARSLGAISQCRGRPLAMEQGREAPQTRRRRRDLCSRFSVNPEGDGYQRGDWRDGLYPHSTERQARRQVCRLL